MEKDKAIILEQKYFEAPATELAPALIGKILCRSMGKTDNGQGTVLRLRITETECYFGEEDTACHAHHGRTPRTEVLYRRGGCVYVYLCYGIHSLLNIVSGAEGHPEAILIRGVEGVVGPGRVTKHMRIDRAENGVLLNVESGLWIEDDGFVPDSIKTDKRVGIGYAEAGDRDRLWRFLLEK